MSKNVNISLIIFYIYYYSCFTVVAQSLCHENHKLTEIQYLSSKTEGSIARKSTAVIPIKRKMQLSPSVL